MVAVHIFAYDWVPDRSEIASGGGLRALQLIEALRAAGYAVTWSAPDDCRHVRRIGAEHPSLRNILLHNAQNQLDILRSVMPDVVIWPPLLRRIPFNGLTDIVHICDLIGLPHYEAALGRAGRLEWTRHQLRDLATGADCFLVGSEEQNGYWISELSRHGDDPATAIVPYTLPISLRSPSVRSKPSRLKTLHITGMTYSWSTSLRLARRAAEWATPHRGLRLSIITGVDPGGGSDGANLRDLAELRQFPNVDMPGEVSFAQAMSAYGPGSVAMDLYDPALERRLAVPIRTVNAMEHGVPLITTIESAFTRRLVAAGAAIVAADRREQALETALETVRLMAPERLAKMGVAARAYAEREFDPTLAAQTLVDAVGEARSRRAARRQQWSRPHGTISTDAVPSAGHILVLSDSGENLNNLRMSIPFNALHGRGLIDGYSVWRKGRFAFSTSSRPEETSFNAIWVQRDVNPAAAVALQTLRQKYIFDVDDNLLTSPDYRPPFSIESIQTVRTLIANCHVLSCSTARLCQLLQEPAMRILAGKCVVTPNLLKSPIPPRPIGEPRYIIWASSDRPALTTSRLSVERAIRDYCLAHDLTLVCIGAHPPETIAISNVKVECVDTIPYSSYLGFLAARAPAIMVCPLETAGSATTQQFVDGKSDIKILEAIAAGLVGVFSRAAPYRDSTLPPQILCENTYAGWFAALGLAHDKCSSPDPAPPVIPERDPMAEGLSHWMDALSRGRLKTPLPAQLFLQTTQLLRSRYGRRRLTQLEFDDTFYTEFYSDVQDAIFDGAIDSAFEHYEKTGYREGRLGRAGDATEPHNENLWANILHTIAEVSASVDRQAEIIEALAARKATALSLRRGPRK